MNFFTGRLPALSVIAMLFLGGCAEVRLFSHIVKDLISDTLPGDKRGTYKVGNPYQIKGTWYYPAEDPDYRATGIASWYGRAFHGKRTANGALYDMNALTAAHRTLPMPFQVRVTNLSNGRSLVLTINDRGPYARGRIIDVSRRAAQLLGFQKRGTTLVRVEAVTNRGLEQPLIIEAEVAAEAVESPEAPSLPASPTVKIERQPLIEVASVDIDKGLSMFVQVGAFSNPENARRLSDALTPFGKTRTSAGREGGESNIYRVTLGPVATPADAEALLERVINAGHFGAHLVIE